MPTIYQGYGHRRRAIENAHRFAWKVLAWREDPHCRSCGRLTELMGRADLKGSDYKKIATVDHVLSRGMGGGDTVENFQLLCGRCNTKKARNEQPKQQGEPA